MEMKVCKKKKFIFRKFISVLMTLAIIVVSGFFNPLQAAADTNKESTGAYKWVLVHNSTTLHKAIEDALVAEYKMRGVTGKTTSFNSLNRSVDNDNDWVRCMLLWQSGGKWYFTSGSSGGEKWNGQVVLSSFDMNPGAEEFTTRSGLNAPFIKRTTGACEYDGKGGGENYSLRLSTGSNTLSNNIAAIHMNWYGFKYHAAAYAEFNLNANTSNHQNGKGKRSVWVSNITSECSYNVMFSRSWADYFTNGISEKEKNTIVATEEYRISYFVCTTHGGYWVSYDPGDKAKYEWALKNLTDTSKYDLNIYNKVFKTTQYPNGISGLEAYQKLFDPMYDAYSAADNTTAEGTCWIYNYFSGVCNRYWEHDGGSIDTCCDRDDSDITGFLMYIGIPYQTPSHEGSYVVEGVEYFVTGEEIKPKCVVTVPVGSTLVISGHVYNNGKIYIDGGTLIVDGVLDSDSSYEGTFWSYYDYYKSQGNPDPTGAAMAYFESQYGPVNQIDAGNDGTIIVTENGAILNRYWGSRIYLFDNSSLTVDGVVCVSNLYVWYGSMVRGDNGSMIAIGCNVNGTVDIENYSSEKLLTNYQLTLSSIFSKATSKTLSIRQDSSFITYGGVYFPSDSNFETYGNYEVWMWRETDGRRTIANAMWMW